MPNAQVYRPSYLFGGDRPVIKTAPKKLSYGSVITIKLKEEGAEKVGSVVLERIGPVTHNWDWGNRYVKLWSKQVGNHVQASAPAVPGLAVPGYYMLFVVSEEGVPSEARIVHLDGKEHVRASQDAAADQQG